jgi:hypothetical protein
MFGDIMRKINNKEYESDEVIKQKSLNNYNKIRSIIADASVDNDYEIYKEFFVLEYHNNDMYTQN